MVYVLSYLCLIAATLSAFTPVLPSMFVHCAPLYNSNGSNLSVSTTTSVVPTYQQLPNVSTPPVSLSLAVVAGDSDSSKVSVNNRNNLNESDFSVLSVVVSNGKLNKRALRTSRSLRKRVRHHRLESNEELGEEENSDDPFVGDNSGRNERSTNLSHITGTSRKIQMYVTNQYLQILSDGTVNGTADDTSFYTILQRIPVKVGHVWIQGVATCQYLCIDACGLLYGSRDFKNEECVFNESIEHNHYNTYSSVKYSNSNRTMYLALKKTGQSRKVLLKTTPGIHVLGKMATYTRVLTKTAPIERVEALEAEMHQALHQASTEASLGTTPHPLRHHGSHQLLCPPIPGDRKSVASKNVKFRCRKRKKRKKKRRKQTEREDVINSVPKHRKHSNSNSSNFKEDNPNFKSKDGSKDPPVLSTDNNSNNKGNHHSSNKQFVFSFNGVTLSDCDQFKNVNKHRKCEEALQRQRAKANFPLREVDVKRKRGGSVVGSEKNVHKRKTEKHHQATSSTTTTLSDDQVHLFEEHTTEDAEDWVTSSTDLNEDIFETATKVPRTPDPPPLNELDDLDDEDSFNLDD